MSISETEVANEQEQRYAGEESTLKICVEVEQHKKGQNMGTGISTENDQNQLQAAWKLRERSTGSMILDNLQAINLAL